MFHVQIGETRIKRHGYENRAKLETEQQSGAYKMRRMPENLQEEAVSESAQDAA